MLFKSLRSTLLISSWIKTKNKKIWIFHCFRKMRNAILIRTMLSFTASQIYQWWWWSLMIMNSLISAAFAPSTYSLITRKLISIWIILWGILDKNKSLLDLSGISFQKVLLTNKLKIIQKNKNLKLENLFQFLKIFLKRSPKH